MYVPSEKFSMKRVNNSIGYVTTSYLCSLAAYVKRVIAHPSFHNIDYKACERLMSDMEMGECIIRPSSKVGIQDPLIKKIYLIFENNDLKYTNKWSWLHICF